MVVFIIGMVCVLFGMIEVFVLYVMCYLVGLLIGVVVGLFYGLLIFFVLFDFVGLIVVLVFVLLLCGLFLVWLFYSMVVLGVVLIFLFIVGLGVINVLNIVGVFNNSVVLFVGMMVVLCSMQLFQIVDVSCNCVWLECLICWDIV